MGLNITSQVNVKVERVQFLCLVRWRFHLDGVALCAIFIRAVAKNLSDVRRRHCWKGIFFNGQTNCEFISNKCDVFEMFIFC